MENKVEKKIPVYMTESQTIIELSQIIQQYDAEIILKKNVNGSIIEANLKSFLGLINLRLHDGDEIVVECVGKDATEALSEVELFLSKG
ncbi:HPr family phosphocarrier protein [Alkalihalobacillus hwajinpoensis]|uniref:HPr family phosphocarrier protein n=1 Tax=Guptibacillus hwajinpoensis TaxID=208199 RepID=UPI001883BA53|nr:HPr family phosphocarrier protein [Pseudalkalibacillus hwajinpoensis]MBF0707831.1 HPr family phosphocarrier protein [Pseudalkalibacillus hwajinpoensis]